MKHMIRISIAVLFMFVLATLYVLYVPPRAGYLGIVSVSVRGYQTNAFGQREALVAITNAGPHILQVGTGTQIRGAGGWQDASGLTNHMAFTLDADPTLRPGTERLFAVSDPQAGVPWRVFAFCQKRYVQRWTAQLGVIADGYVLKRRLAETFYTSEIRQ